MFLNYEQTRLQPHAIPNSIFRTNLEITDEAESIEAQNIIKVEQKDVIMEVDTTNLLEKDTTMQENINEILLNTETPMSSSIGNTKIPISSSIGTQTLIASSSRGTQTSLSLSARSLRKVHLHREIQKYKKQILSKG